MLGAIFGGQDWIALFMCGGFIAGLVLLLVFLLNRPKSRGGEWRIQQLEEENDRLRDEISQLKESQASSNFAPTPPPPSDQFSSKPPPR